MLDNILPENPKTVYTSGVCNNCIDTPQDSAEHTVKRLSEAQESAVEALNDWIENRTLPYQLTEDGIVFEGHAALPLDFVEFWDFEGYVSLAYELEKRFSVWARRPFKSDGERDKWQAYKRADGRLYYAWESWRDDPSYSNAHHLGDEIHNRTATRLAYFEISSRDPVAGEFSIFEMLSGLAGEVSK